MTCRQIYNGSMPLSINDPAAEALVRELTVKTGETAEQAVAQSVKERLQRLSADEARKPLVEELNKLALSYASQPVLDSRDPDEILGYDENGLPS